MVEVAEIDSTLLHHFHSSSGNDTSSVLVSTDLGCSLAAADDEVRACHFIV